MQSRVHSGALRTAWTLARPCRCKTICIILNSWFEGMWLQPKHMRVTVRDGIVLGMKRRGGRKGLRVDGAQYGEYKLRTLSEERQSQVEKMKAR
jgi:hypothetical protein